VRRTSRAADRPGPPLTSHIHGFLLLAAATALLAASGCKKGDDSSESHAAASAASVDVPSATAEPSASAAESASAAPTIEPPKATARPPTNTAGANAVKACCNALNAEAAKAKASDKGPYQSAASVCSALSKSVESGSVTPEGAKLTIRAQLQRAKSIPPACK
jgi:hypothetical protein